MSKALELAKFGRETPPVGVVVGDSDAQTLSSKTFSDSPVFSGNAINGVGYLNASKVFSTVNTFVFDGVNLGIGVTNPAQRLDVNGTVKIGSGSGETLSVGSIDLGRDIGLADGQGIVTGNARVLTFKTSGNVGVGTASPAATLHTFGTGPIFERSTTATTSVRVAGVFRANSTGSAADNFGPYIEFQLTDAETSLAVLGGIAAVRAGADNTGNLTFFTSSAGSNTEKVRIDQSGNVGMGTATPRTKLDVRGTSNTSAASLQIVGENVSTLLLGQNADGGVIRGQGGNSVLSFWTGGVADTGAGLSGSERMRIRSDGNVGINDTNPVAKLSVGGSATFFGAEFNSGTHNGIRVGSGPNYNWEISREGVNSGHLRFVENNNNTITERMRIAAGGDVLINAYSNTGGGKIDITSNSTAVIQARSTATGTGDGTADVTVIRAVTAGASWWANARYDAFSHTWGRSGSATATTGMVLTGPGYLGIGTTDPQSMLTIGSTGTDSLANATINQTTDFAATSRAGFSGLTNNNGGFYFGMGANGSGIPAGFGFFREAGGWNTALAFYTNNQTSGTYSTRAMQEKMRLNSDGWLGIGTKTPFTQLDVNGGVRAQSTNNTIGGLIAADSNGVAAKFARITANGSDVAFGQNIITYPGTWTKANTAEPSGGWVIGTDGNAAYYKSSAGSSNPLQSALLTLSSTGLNMGGGSLYFERSGIRSWQLYANQSTGQAWLASGDSAGTFTIASAGVSIATGLTPPVNGLRVSGATNPAGGIVSTNLIQGYVASNYTGTRYWVLHRMQTGAGVEQSAFNCMGDIHASSYTTWNLCNLWIRREYASTNVFAGITGIIKSSVTVSVVDITYNNVRYVAIKFAGGDPGIEANLVGYLMDQQYTNGTDAFFINGTAGVTEIAVIASY
jgi:hypothetical protein